MKPINDLVKLSIRGVLFSKETAQQLKDNFLGLSKKNSIEAFMEMMFILHELAIAEDKTILSSYFIILSIIPTNLILFFVISIFFSHSISL